MDLSLLRACSN